MCRMLFVRKKEEFNVVSYLEEFSRIAKNARHNQRDGWGFCYLDGDTWKLHRSVKPMWEDEIPEVSSRVIIAHVRDALRLHTINAENNMPFVREEYAFAFNGRLKGVRISAEGETGAHKLFNVFLDHIDRLGFDEGVREAIDYVQDNVRYIRAFNLMISNKEKTYVYCRYSEEEDFFQIRYGEVVCSEPFLDLTPEIMNNGELIEC